MSLSSDEPSGPGRRARTDPADPHAATMLPPSSTEEAFAPTLAGEPGPSSKDPHDAQVALAKTLDGEPAKVLASPSAVTAPLSTAELGGTLPPESLPGSAPAPQISVGLGAAARNEFPVANWDHYEFLKLLGRGGMGAVYKARDKRLHRTVALKFIRGADPNLVMRFMQEARAQARIDHPQVCKVYEIGEVQGHAYIAMQYVDGKSLDSSSLQLSLTQKVVLMRQVAEAMHEAHKLGIIHRDLKPANIMLEREVDGSLNPIVMDFGLARESSESHGLTETGAVMGTPAYMAPEQARGETRLIDRRSDVYSLGATLYDLIVGVPPFDANSVMDILLKVISDDAKPLRTAVPSVPPDLETIVMKCLNKEPNQRYDSAKLLAEDLGRYIDGEPILGRRVSLVYRLRRQAKRQRALFAVSAVFLVILLGFSGGGIRQYLANQRERKRIAAQAMLEQELAQQIKDMEWFLRTAYQLPLHDIGEEQAIIRQRMEALPKPSASLGERGVGLVHYARGRGHLALHETDPALKELRLAQQKGVDTQELHYALGRALGDKYDQAMEDARRQGEKLWLEGRQKELEIEFLQPALAELERSRGLQLASPDYLDGLIAFYRKQYDQALLKARQAESKARWWYEARQLEGDVFLARGTEQKEHGQYDEAAKSLQAAIDNYKIASDIGRSDASIYESAAQALIEQSEIALNAGKPTDLFFTAALAAAEHSVVALPSNPRGYLAESRVAFFSGRAGARRGTDPSEIFKQSIHFAEQALARDPQNFIAWDTLGNTLNFLANRESSSGKDSESTRQRAVEAFGKAIAIAPNFPWAHNDLGNCYWFWGNDHAQHGRDPRERYQLAISAVKRATELDPKYVVAYSNLVGILGVSADYSREHGQDFANLLKEANILAQRCGAGCRNNLYFQLNMAGLHLTGAQHALRQGMDPRPAIAMSRSYLATLRERSKSAYQECVFPRLADSLEAEYLLATDSEPTQLVESALTSLQSCKSINAQSEDAYVVESRLLRVRASWLERHGGNPLPAVRAAMAAAVAAFELNAESDEAAHEKSRAAFLLARNLTGKARGQHLSEGLLAVEQGIKVKADSGPLLAMRAVLLHALAPTARSPAEQASLQRRSAESWQQALAINPLLEREYGPYLAAP